MKILMATTTDNPFDPFTEYNAWRSYDRDYLGYNTESWVAAYSRSSPDDSFADSNDDNTKAVEKLIKLNPFGKHIKVEKEV